MKIHATLSKRTIFLLLVTGFLGLVSLPLVLSDNNPVECSLALPHTKTGQIALAGNYQPFRCVTLERADTPESRQRGLSNRNKMPDTSGMLFVFDDPKDVCIWMKDMKFDIDILWLNEQKEIIKIRENVRPETYPESFCRPNTKYVIELNAGVFKKANLKHGQRLNF